jgi:hypothetical protein
MRDEFFEVMGVEQPAFPELNAREAPGPSPGVKSPKRQPEPCGSLLDPNEPARLIVPHTVVLPDAARCIVVVPLQDA